MYNNNVKTFDKNNIKKDVLLYSLFYVESNNTMLFVARQLKTTSSVSELY